MAIKPRYSDEDLEEFRQVINEKLKLARRDYESLTKYLKRVALLKVRKN